MGVGLQCSSDGGNWFSIVGGLACQCGGVLDGCILVPDLLPHEITRGWGCGGGGNMGRRGKLPVPEASLGLVGTVLGSGIVLVNRECK